MGSRLPSPRAAAQCQRDSLVPRFSKVFLGRGCSAEMQVRCQASCRGALGPPHQGAPCVSESGEDSEGLGGNPLFRRQSPLLRLVSPTWGKLTAVRVVICLSVCLSFWGRVRGELVTEHRSRRAPLQAGGGGAGGCSNFPLQGSGPGEQPGPSPEGVKRRFPSLLHTLYCVLLAAAGLVSFLLLETSSTDRSHPRRVEDSE